MSASLQGGLNPQRPEPSNRNQKLTQGLNAACDDFKAFFEHFKYVILIPLSWSLTLWHFAIVLTWGILTLPLRFAISFYELQVRRVYPWLPSIWGTLFKLFPEGIKIPTLTSLTAGPFKGEGPTGPNLPTLDNSAELDAIINGGANGNGNAPSSIESSRSKLETALKKIPATSPSNLDAILENVKAAQAETEKALGSLIVSS